MADIAGFGGAATFAATDFNLITLVHDWTVTFDVGVHVIKPEMGKTYRRAYPTDVGLTGSANGETLIANVASSQPFIAPGDGTSLVANFTGSMVLTFLTPTTACSFTFAAVASNLRFNRDHSGGSPWSFDFTSNGVLTIAWDITP